MNAPITAPILRIVLAYAFFAASWILLSDQALALLVSDAATFARLSTYKGWAFVAVTSVLLALLLRRELLARRRAYAEVENEVARRTVELAKAMRAAQSADRLKSAFLATMSHEIRTPLNSIVGFSGILLQELAGPLNDEQKKQLGMLQKSSRHLLALINDILDLSKIETGELRIARAAFDPLASIDNAVNLVRPLAESKGLTLTQTVQGDIPEMNGDRRRFEQVLINLLGNAVKFTEIGSITVGTDILGAYNGQSDGMLRVRISDTGIGILPDEMAQLFQPFHQIDSTLSRKHEGSGLGLVISRRLAALMGGSVEAQSRWGEGSTFTLMLPFHPPQTEDTR